MLTIFSPLIHARFDKPQRTKLADELKAEHGRTGKHFIEKRVTEFEFIYCDFKDKSVQICFEEEW